MQIPKTNAIYGLKHDFMDFRYDNTLSSVLFMYMTYKSYWWFIDMIYLYIYGFQGHVYGWDIFYDIIWFLVPPNLVCDDSMSIIEVWELRTTPSWRGSPLESFIPWYCLELGAAYYAFLVGATSKVPILLRHGIEAACYAFVREPPSKSLSLYVCPSGAHHSSHMPLRRVYSVYDLWGRLLVSHFYGFSRLVYG